jgi:glycosyltransferase involved in cell wall biosynthesis
MWISVVVPAFNEEKYLGDTLASLNRAKLVLQKRTDCQAEIIVVDNNSNDSTRDVARSMGARVVSEPHHNIARVRNTGAKLAQGEVIIFVDADTVVPETMLSRIFDVMSDATSFGGTVDAHYQPHKLTIKVYLQCWRVIGKVTAMAQGATQFFHKDAFLQLNGYDESLFMGEDVDLYWRLQKLARQQNARVTFVDDIQVIPSTRRFDNWPLWRTLVWTNPLFILLFRRSKRWWHGWYKSVPR